MSPIRLTLTIDLPPDGTPERAKLNRTTLGELLGVGKPTVEPDRDPDPRPPVRPHRPEPDEHDEPYGVQMDDPPADDPNTPRSGKQLLGWIGKQPDSRELQRIAASIAKDKGYGSLLMGLDAAQAHNVYHALLARPARRARRGG